MKRVGDTALIEGDFFRAEECFKAANDLNSLFFYYSNIGDAQGVAFIAEKATQEAKYNLAFSCYNLLQDVEGCLNTLWKA